MKFYVCDLCDHDRLKNSGNQSQLHENNAVVRKFLSLEQVL